MAMPKAKDADKSEQSHRAFNQKLIERLVKDPRFRKELLNDTQAALRSAKLDRELLKLEKLDQQNELLAIGCAPLSCVGTCKATCKTNTCIHTTTC
jgi:hypothetical protein